MASTVTPTQDITIVTPSQDFALVDVYDPTRNPAEDLKQAVAVAQHENKRIILELGGDWCRWFAWVGPLFPALLLFLEYRTGSLD